MMRTPESPERQFADHKPPMRYLDEINAGEARPRRILLRAQGASAAATQGTALIASQWSARDR